MRASGWFHSPIWNDSVAAQFEARLLALRPAERPGCLRLQGVQLTRSDDADTREHGRRLFERVIREYPYNFEAKWACEQLGTSHQQEGRLDEAEAAFRHCITMCKQSPIGYAGGSGVPELSLAEVLLVAGGRADEAWELLEAVGPRVEAQKRIRSTVFRHLSALARAAAELGLPAAADLAAGALDVAVESEPALPRHPTLGRPTPAEAELKELRTIARG